MTRVSILSTQPQHPVNAWLEQWKGRSTGIQVDILRDARELIGGDFLFLVSCHQIVPKEIRTLFRRALVLHASALPKGRGMSPHIWQILEGANSITITLLNAEDALDSGDIWHQIELRFDGTELYDEINRKIFDAELMLMDWALAHCDRITPRKQEGDPSFYRKRRPVDSAIDPSRPLVESFNQLRVADPERYPAYFEYRGQKYRIRIEKM
jgi:methionyl-tRNA formyltransferase